MMTTQHDAGSNPINWTVVIVQAVVQVVILGSLAVGYVITNERWKGGVDANLANLVIINQNQAITNTKLQTSIEKLGDTVNLLGRNQEKVITIIDAHITEDKLNFKKVSR